MSDDLGDSRPPQSLLLDYERIAALRLKRTVDLETSDDDARPALARLVDAAFAVHAEGTIVLMRPDDLPVPPGEAYSERLHTSYQHWLRTDRPGASDELLYGEPGFWQHWWNRIRDRDYAADGPLAMDVVVPDDGSFLARAWLTEFDPEIRAHVLGQDLIRGRAIVPPGAIRSAVEPMLDLSAESGLEVRVLSTEARFVLYDGETAILNEPHLERSDGVTGPPEAYWAVRDASVVSPLRQFFDLLWALAAPYRAHRGEHDEMLELLGRGCTDVQVAETLNVSHRTVSRRVAELMTEFGASSRFELGMRYERARRQTS